MIRLEDKLVFVGRRRLRFDIRHYMPLSSTGQGMPSHRQVMAVKSARKKRQNLFIFCRPHLVNSIMPLVSLRSLHYRQQECIGIYYSSHAAINAIVKRMAGIKWSQTNHCWYLPLSPESYNQVVKALKGKAEVDSAALKGYLQKGKKVLRKMPVVVKNADKKSIQLPVSPTGRLSEDNLAALERFKEQLKLKAYSASTSRTYRNEFMQLLKLLNEKPVNDLTVDELRRYFVYCFDKLHLTEHTLHSRMSAIYPVGLKK